MPPDISHQSLILHSPGPSCVHLRGLRFAFPVVAEVIEGDCKVFLPGRMLASHHGVLHEIRPLESPRLVLAKRARVAFRPLSAPAHPVQARMAGKPYKPAASALALAVFESPHKPWQLASASKELRFDQVGRLSRTLMSEGESFLDLVSTQRLMRALFDLAEADWPATRGEYYGFPDRARLENAIFDRFGVNTSLLHRLLNR